jgi:hypothetical protein
MDAFRQEAEDSCLQFCSNPTVQEFAEVKRPFSIDNLIGLLRANERNIFSLASKRAIDPLTLRTQLLLHLPRLFTTDDLPSARDIQQEILAVSDFVEDRQHRYAHWLKPPERPIALSDLEFVSLDAETAKIYHECFHYVGSFRPGEHFALRVKDSDRVVCVGSIAGFDLKHAEEKIAPHIDPRSVSVFSRFFTFRWAPQNTFSYFWGRLRRQLREEYDTKLMFSFINPNMGFNACSHKAAQWKLFAQEAGTHYMYLDGRYRTMRFFVENCGMNDPDELKEKLGNSFEVSTMKLYPVQLLAIPLQRWARKLIPVYPYQFQRPVLAGARINPPQALQAAE